MRVAAAVVFVMALLPVSSRARGPIVAVFDMEDKGSGLQPEVLINLGDYLGVLLTKGGYQVVPRSEIRERLKAQKRESYKSCYDQSCQIELGREMAAEKTLATWVLKIGKNCQVTATLYDLKKGTTEKAAVQEAVCDEESLLQAVKALAADLCQGLEEASANIAEAEIKVAVARKEAEAARREARQKAEELERMRREVAATKKKAAATDAARIAAQQKVKRLEKQHAAADARELEQARQEARQAREIAERAKAERQAALRRIGDLAKAQQEAEQARLRAERAERATARAEQARKQAEQERKQAEREAEDARREAERARKYPEGRPTEDYNVGVGIVGIAPDVTNMHLDLHQQGERTATYAGGFGLAVKADFMLASWVSLGGQFFYGQGEVHDPDDPVEEDRYNKTHLLDVSAAVKGRINLGVIEFRPGLAIGYQHLDGSSAGKVDGLGLTASVETAFYLSRYFALTVDLSMKFMPVAAGEEGDLTYTTPLLLLALGAEYCD